MVKNITANVVPTLLFVVCKGVSRRPVYHIAVNSLYILLQKLYRLMRDSIRII
jgi:hypothetical protein